MNSRTSWDRCFWAPEEVTSMVGAEPRTMIVSVTPPTSSVVSTLMVCPSCRRASRRAVLKPDSSKATVYVPGGSAGKRYTPFASVVIVLEPPISDSLDAVTVAPTRAAPLESVTVPVRIEIWPICASAGNGLNRSAAPSRMSNFFLIKSHSFGRNPAAGPGRSAAANAAPRSC